MILWWQILSKFFNTKFPFAYIQVYTIYIPLHRKLLTLSHATCQWEKATNINIHKCFFRHESSSWGVRLLCRLPLQGSQEAMTLTVSQSPSSILTKYQSHFSPDFSSAWAYLHFLPNPVAYQKSLFSRPVYLQQTSNILFSTSKSHLTSFLKIWH